MDNLIRNSLRYDPNTGELTWATQKGGRGAAGCAAGTIDRTGYRRIKLNGSRLLAHRVAWFLTHGEWPVGVIDHINRNKLDNRIENLRDVSVAENSRNREFDETRGTFKASRNRWAARVTRDGVTRYLGVFDSLDKARQAYLAALQ
jgi:hypothetical protein